MRLPDFRKSYQLKTRRLLRRQPRARAMSKAVGGSFDAAGRLEAALLQLYGLERDHTLIDVGCGSGRLAVQLTDYLRGRYVGMDVVEELVEYARESCNRPDWSFYQTRGVSIPEADQSADMVCFFSVLTHLLHEESYRYLAEANRTLRPGGRIVFSFLEFHIPEHWTVFEATMADNQRDKVLNQFISRDAVTAWAHHLGLDIEAIHDGNRPHIPFEGTIEWDHGQQDTGEAALGQSVCVLKKPTANGGSA